ncbi:TolC family protein [Marinilabilia salmonicolor]|uniref:TolC family protein n=1 Tax=Marinilabilia salmonicolor TaxID=989 RepID=UPI0009DAB41F|nr:TolC family protein [Marinilabilia salmonicolor]
MRLERVVSELFCMLFLLPAITLAQEPQLLTFEDALLMMSENNPALKRQREEIRQREFEIKSRRGLRYPTVALNAQAVSMSDPLHLDLTPVRDAITPLYNTLGNYGVFSGVPNPDPATNQQFPTLPDAQSTEGVRQQLLAAEEEIKAAEWDKMIQKKNFAVVSAGFVWPLYAGGKINGANHAAGVNREISKEELRHTEGRLLTELTSRYYGLVLAMEIVKLREQMLESMNNHYHDASKLFENGMIAKVELLHAKVSKNEAERQLKEAQRNIEIIRSGLAATLGNDSLQQVMPLSRLFINKNIESLNYWIETAKISNPQLKQIDGKKELVEIKHKIERNAYLPSIAAMGNYNIADIDLSPYTPQWLVGVGLKWTLFEGMTRRNDLKTSGTLKKQVEYARQKANNDLTAYLTKLYNELQMQMEQKNDLETTLELANEYCSSTEKAFNEGLANSTKVVEAHSKVIQAKVMRLKVLYDYDVALSLFFQTTGTPQQFLNYSLGENTILESL